MFKPEFATMVGEIPLDIPHGRTTPARLQVDDKGKIQIVFEDVEFARKLFMSGVEGQLESLSVGYVKKAEFRIGCTCGDKKE